MKSRLRTSVHPLVLRPCQIANTNRASFNQTCRIRIEWWEIFWFPLRECSDPWADPEKREKLAKFWMPLDEFTNIAVDGLRKGDKLITCGTAEGTFNRFEQGKEEVAAQLGARRIQWAKD